MQSANMIKRLLEHGIDLSDIDNLNINEFRKELLSFLMQKHFSIEENNCIIAGDICDDIAVISFNANTLSITPIRQFGFLDIAMDLLKFYLSYSEKKKEAISPDKISDNISDDVDDEDSKELWL